MKKAGANRNEGSDLDIKNKQSNLADKTPRVRTAQVWNSHNKDERTGNQNPKAKRKASCTELPESPMKKSRLSAAEHLSITKTEDAKALESVEARYNVQIQSVISSSKIQRKVTSVLRHLTLNDSSAKPRVSILRAKAPDAGKLISIAEIAKRDLLLPDFGRWFQYIALGEDIKERPRETDKTVIEETVLGDEDADDDAEDDFEVMKTPFERAIEGRPVIRKVPVLSLFLSRVPIDELKRHYGEQTSESLMGPT